MAEGRPQVVYSDVAEGADLQGQLFAGKKFFIAQRCPMRSSFVEQVKSNGGQVVPFEKLADYLIVDHMRKDIPAGSISYTFIEQSIRKGELESPDDHIAGELAGAVRDIGSSRQTKSGRVLYTAEDDRQLYNWIKAYERRGGATMGNEIYKQLEQKNPRHPWQSWRDRYVKQLQYKPPPGCAPANGPLSPPSDVPPSDVDLSAGQPLAEQPKERKFSRYADKAVRAESESDISDDTRKGPVWTSEDWDELYANADNIENAAKRYLTGWEERAKGTNRTAQQRRDFYEKKVLPRWEEDHEDQDHLQEAQDQEAQDQEAQDTIEVKPAKEQRQKSTSPASESSTPKSRKHQRPSSPKKSAKLRNPSSVQKGDLEKSNAQTSPSALQSPVVADSGESFDLVFEMMARRKGQQPMKAYRFYFEAYRHEVKDCDPTDYSAPHRKLNPRWKALSDKDRAPYYEMEAADKERHRLENSPTEYREWRLKHGASSGSDTRKRSREEDDDIEETQKESPDSRMNKRQRQQERDAGLDDGHREAQGRIQNAMEHDQDAIEQDIGQEESSWNHDAQKVYVGILDDSESEEGEDETPEEAPEDIVPKHRIIDLSDDENESEKEDEEEEGEEEQEGEEEVDTNGQAAMDNASASPLPRESRYKPPTTLDTQAILADPTQVLDVSLAELPNTLSDTSSLRSSSPLPGHTASYGASHSIREFRSLEDLERQRHSTPPLDMDMPPPEIDSDDEMDSQDVMSDDPDPPLDEEGTVEFYHEMLSRGYDDELIRDVMRACITRAKLSEEVLAELAQGKPWPERRGVWTAEDDRDLESTDARRVRRVMKKHTDDEWGGCQERRIALDFIRQVSEQQQG